MIKVHKTIPIAIHCWDFKDQPNWHKIISIISNFQGRFNNGIQIMEVDTGCDGYAIVIGDRSLDDQGAQYWYDTMFDSESIWKEL